MSHGNAGPIPVGPNANIDVAEDECEMDEGAMRMTRTSDEVENEDIERATDGADAGQHCHPVEADVDVDHEEADPDVEAEEEHRPAQGLRDPGQPTPAERAEHNLTHIPYRPWCKHCVRGKAKGRPSRRLRATDAESICPRIRFDYCMISDRSESGG